MKSPAIGCCCTHASELLDVTPVRTECCRPTRARWALSVFAGAVSCRASAVRDPSKRVVITGIGLCSVFGNDPDTFYDRWATALALEQAHCVQMVSLDVLAWPCNGPGLMQLPAVAAQSAAAAQQLMQPQLTLCRHKLCIRFRLRASQLSQESMDIHGTLLVLMYCCCCCCAGCWLVRVACRPSTASMLQSSPPALLHRSRILTMRGEQHAAAGAAGTRCVELAALVLHNTLSAAGKNISHGRAPLWTHSCFAHMRAKQHPLPASFVLAACVTSSPCSSP